LEGIFNMITKKHRYGWLRDRPDQRDIPYMSIRFRSAIIELPKSVDLRPYCPPVFDQGELGSCTANAIVAAYEIDRIKRNWNLDPLRQDSIESLSRLFVYYNERLIEGTTQSDAGAFIRDGIKTIARDGICTESCWPYDISKFTSRPDPECYVEGLKRQAIQYAAVGADYHSVCTALSDGYPVVFGFSVYSNFETEEVARTGIMPLPSDGANVLGGHAVVAVGYDMDLHQLLVRNSWGSSWGIGGYFWMPFAALGTISSDFWVIRQVE